MTACLAAVFAFININGQPFNIFFVNFLQTASRPPLRVWDKTLNNTELKLYVAQKQERVQVATSSSKARPESSRLRDIALTVNTGGVYNAEE
jgi:hypothetical protein